MTHRVRSVVALALGTATAAAAPPRVVRVYVAGTEAAVAGTRDALRDRCARPELLIVVEDARAFRSGASTWGDEETPSDAGATSKEALLLGSGQPTDLAVGYVTVEPAAESRVVFVDGRTHDELERRVLERTDSLEMSIETVAHVICATVDSTLAMQAAPPAAKAPAQAVATVPSEPAPARVAAETPFGAWAGVFGTGADFGAGFRGGAGGLVGATTGFRRVRASLLLSAADFPSQKLDRQGASPSFGLFGARLLPAASVRVADDIEALLGVGPGLDWLEVSPNAPPPGGTAETGVSSVELMLSALAGARLRVGGHVGIWLALGADLDAYRHRYVNAANGAPVGFFEMPRLRANGQAGLTVAFGRDGPMPHAAPGAQSGSLP